VKTKSASRPRNFASLPRNGERLPSIRKRCLTSGTRCHACWSRCPQRTCRGWVRRNFRHRSVRRRRSSGIAAHRGWLALPDCMCPAV